MVAGQHRMRVMAMVWMALLRARSPPRLSRCRTVLPLLARSGLVPDSAANAASFRHPRSFRPVLSGRSGMMTTSLGPVEGPAGADDG